MTYRASTDTFSGTSSASPIVTGAIACIQGLARAKGRPVLTPAQVRNCLRSTGSPQQAAPGRPATQRIGNRPDIRAFATCAFGKSREITKEAVKEFKEKDTRCIALARRLNLPLAGIDLRCTPEGRHVCFEVNPSPAFSFYERRAGLPIARTMARYLAGEIH